MALMIINKLAYHDFDAFPTDYAVHANEMCFPLIFENKKPG